MLTTLTTLFRKTSLKMHSLETTLTTLIHIKNSFITEYADNDDIQDNMKNSFFTEFADYPVFNARWEMISSLTTLTTLICKTTLKIISSLTHADYNDFHDNVKNNFINNYADYTAL